MNFINLLKRPDLPLSNPKYSTTAMNALERVGIIWISTFISDSLHLNAVIITSFFPKLVRKF